MKSLLTALKYFQADGDYVLAIITQTQGSTYRKTGSLMLIDVQLNAWGLLSGGCLEGDVTQRSKLSFSERRDQTIHYDMRDTNEQLWGMGLGCDGSIDLLLKYLPASENHFDFFKILQQIENGHSYLMHVSPQNNFALSFCSQGQHSQSVPKEKPSELLTIALPAPYRILICGAAPDAAPVTQLCKALGWKTTVIDHRADFAQTKNFPDADQVAVIKRSEWKNFSAQEFDAVIIMSHQFERDADYLKLLLASDIAYIGLLGPSKRRDQLLSKCLTDFSQVEGRVFGPIGLDIGADTPETIALAIVGEIQAVKAQKQVGFCYQDKTR